MSLEFIEIDVNRYAPDYEIEASRKASYDRNIERLDSLFKKRVRAVALGVTAFASGLTTIEFVNPNTVNTPVMRYLGALGLKHEVGPTHPIKVKPGDSLWSIAEKIPGGNTQQAVEDIASINHLTTPTIVPGEILEIPAYDK